jgi:hypothetical protein
VAEIFVVILRLKKKEIYFLSFFDNVRFEVKRLTLPSTLLRTTTRKSSLQRAVVFSIFGKKCSKKIVKTFRQKLVIQLPNNLLQVRRKKNS